MKHLLFSWQLCCLNLVLKHTHYLWVRGGRGVQRIQATSLPRGRRSWSSPCNNPQQSLLSWMKNEQEIQDQGHGHSPSVLTACIFSLWSWRNRYGQTAKKCHKKHQSQRNKVVKESKMHGQGVWRKKKKDIIKAFYLILISNIFLI